MTHPLVKIRFEFVVANTLQPVVIKYWYHVPRVGDGVTVREGPVQFSGPIEAVWWFEDNVTVRLNPAIKSPVE